ncbi:MAG: RHS repeat-associated core domain-containing protein, partial [Firmicutes bacterium]|nr:RHS repeat-associated core domain-containing protein [Bacillota bacterium]
DAAGNVVASYKFKPYGETESYSGSFSTEYQFTGKPVSDEVGLSYYGARWYDPEVGRFLTQDPAKQGLNWYAYCANNPINRIDPDGRFSFLLPLLGYVFGQSFGDPDKSYLDAATKGSEAALLFTGAGEAYGAFKFIKAMTSYTKPVTYTPVNEGPLPESVTKTFRSSTYTKTVTDTEITLYRAYGGKGKELGILDYR